MNASRIQRYRDKFEHIAKYYKLLKEWVPSLPIDTTEFQLKHERIFATYHAFQLAIEAISDVAAMIVKDLNRIPKDDYHNFAIIIEEQVISSKLDEPIRKLRGLRNRVVHDYNGLIDDIAIEEIKKYLPIVLKYLEDVEKWLGKQEKTKQS